jgi:hypothetical protein
MTFARIVDGYRPAGRHHRRHGTTGVGAGAAVTGDRLQRWEWAARAALAEVGIGYDEASALLASVRRHCLDTGQLPWEAFGSPANYAARALSSRRPRMASPVG